MLHRSAPLGDIRKQFKHTLCSLTARHTFTTRFILGKIHKETCHFNHATLIIHNNKAAGTNHGTYFFQRIKIQFHIQMMFCRTDTQTSAGWSTNLNRFKSTTFDTAANIKNNFTQRRSHWHLNQTGILHIAGKGKCFRTMVVCRSIALIPFGAI